MREEIAWAAGLFEGEGCITHGRRGQPCLQLQMTDFDVVERFHGIVGIGSVNSRRPYGSPNFVYRWGAWKLDEIVELMAKFEPWLGERRLARWRELHEDATPPRRYNGDRRTGIVAPRAT